MKMWRVSFTIGAGEPFTFQNYKVPNHGEFNPIKFYESITKGKYLYNKPKDTYILTNQIRWFRIDSVEECRTDMNKKIRQMYDQYGLTINQDS